MPELIMSYQLDADGTMHDLKREGELVRCGDCKFYKSMIPPRKFGICSLASRRLGDDGYCSEGERKE